MAEVSDKLREGIAYFEQILQMMPEDRSTLEFLCIAYEQTGEMEKYRQVLVSLAEVLVKERDFESASKLLKSIESRAEPEAKVAALKIRAMVSPVEAGLAKAGAGPVANAMPSPSSNGCDSVLEPELELAKWLAAKKVIDQETCDRVCAQLRELIAIRGEFLISALQILENENSVLAEAAAAEVADESKTPPVALEAFDQVLALSGRLPERLVKVRGAVPFGMIADDLLVALANPMDERLKMEVVSAYGGRCHFFFVPPQSLGLVMNRLFPEAEK